MIGGAGLALAPEEMIVMGKVLAGWAEQPS